MKRLIGNTAAALSASWCWGLCLVWCLSATSRLSADEPPVRVIFDTDITGDVDDVLALAMLHTLADRNECILEAVTISKQHPLAAPFVDAVNTFYGRPDIPIGVGANVPDRDSKYLHLVETKEGDAFRYPHDLVTSQQADDAVALMRKTLAAAEDRSIVLVQVGLAVNLADLIESKPDEHCELSGEELVRQKVHHASIMAGAFSPVRGEVNYREANVRNHVDSMQRLADKWPREIPIIWSDFMIGIKTPYPRQSIAHDFGYLKHHLVREAYLLHSGPNHDRPSWDLTSVLHAVRPNDDYFGLSPRGTVSVDDEGVTTFQRDVKGRDQYLILNALRIARVIEAQRALVSQPPRSCTNE